MLAPPSALLRRTASCHLAQRDTHTLIPVPEVALPLCTCSSIVIAMLVPNFGSDCENGVNFGIGGRYRSKRTLVGVKAPDTVQLRRDARVGGASQMSNWLAPGFLLLHFGRASRKVCSQLQVPTNVRHMRWLHQSSSTVISGSLNGLITYRRRSLLAAPVGPVQHWNVARKNHQSHFNRSIRESTGQPPLNRGGG